MKKNLVYSLNKEELFQFFGTSRDGLSSQRAKELTEKYGQNALSVKEKASVLLLYLSQFKNTLTIILIIAALLILFVYQFGEKHTSDLIEAGLILSIVFLITIVGFIQEFKAERAIESLKRLLAFKAKVRRDGVEKIIDVADLVVGDIVILEEGIKVPADIRLIEVFEMRVNEASLTGESAPVSKNSKEIFEKKQLADQQNMLFAGTNVATGRGVGVVVATGDSTEIGKIAQEVAEAKEDPTPSQIRLAEIGKKIGFLIIGICFIVFVFIFFFAKDFANLEILDKILQSFIAAVALAVAAIPEGLPAVVTISLALGTQRMLRRNSLVRKLNSVETLGSTDVICSDKTGTFTKGEMTVRKIFFDNSLYDVDGTGYDKVGNFYLKSKKINPNSLRNLLDAGLLCNNASINSDKPTGDPTEIALLVSAYKAGLDSSIQERVLEIPFSSERKMMTVAVKINDGYIVYSKGAVEILLDHCNVSSRDKKEYLKTNAELSKQALRNIGFAYKNLSVGEFNKQKNNFTKLESDLKFIGIQGMIDPPRVEVKPLIEKCLTSGIRVVMITGDNVDTARAVAAEIGIRGEALTGLEIDKLSEKEFEEAVERVSIYARVNPGVKMRIVNALKKNGHTVAMTGDGVNDAPALKAADIGIAMGITGTDVAKEASDMVLLDDKFSTIVAAIEEGRGIFHNIRKFIRYLLSCNIAEVLIVFFGVIVFQELVLTATMLLWVNVVTDGIPAIALGMDEAEKNIMRYKPQVFQADIVNKELWAEMATFGVLLAIGVMGIFVINLPLGIEKAQSAAFLALVIFELVNIYIIRSNYNTPFFSNKWLFISISITISLQILIVSNPFASKIFGVIGIDYLDWVYIIAVSGLLGLIFRSIQPYLDRISPGQA